VAEKEQNEVEKTIQRGKEELQLYTIKAWKEN